MKKFVMLIVALIVTIGIGMTILLSSRADEVLEVNRQSVYLNVGAKYDLSSIATIKEKSDGAYITYTISSADQAFAKMDAANAGVVEGLSGGTATVIISVSNGIAPQSCFVTINVGDGINTPFYITNEQEFLQIGSHNYTFKDKTGQYNKFMLTENLNFDAYEEVDARGYSFYDPIEDENILIGAHPTECAAEFNGVFDGNGKTISNITFSNKAGAAGAGLFINVGAKGEVKNLTVTNAEINNTAGRQVGIIAAKSAGKISGVSVKNSVIENAFGSTNTIMGEEGADVGGLAGLLTGEIINSSFTGSLTNEEFAEVNIGGIAGRVTGGRISNSNVNAIIKGYASVLGGIVGDVTNGLITFSYSEGTFEVISGSTSIGGIAGNLKATTIYSCYSTSEIITNGVAVYIGGIAATVTANTTPMSVVMNTHFYGKITGTATEIGAVIGNVSAAATNCTTILVRGNYYINGVATLGVPANLTAAASTFTNNYMAQPLNANEFKTVANFKSYDKPLDNSITFTGGSVSFGGSETVLWDFENIWTFTTNSAMPTLKNGAVSKDGIDTFKYETGTVTAVGINSHATLVSALTNYETGPKYWVVTGSFDITAGVLETMEKLNFEGKWLFSVDAANPFEIRNLDTTLFASIGAGSQIKNINFANVNINNGSGEAAAIAFVNNGLIENCNIKGGSVVGAAGTAGIVALNNSTIRNCMVENVAISGGSAGGIATGNSEKGIITGAYVKDNLNTRRIAATSANCNAGGIVDWNKGIIEYSAVEGVHITANATSGAAGGIVGYNFGTIQYNTVIGFTNDGTTNPTVRAFKAGALVGLDVGSLIKGNYVANNVFVYGGSGTAANPGFAGGLVAESTGSHLATLAADLVVKDVILRVDEKNTTHKGEIKYFKDEMYGIKANHGITENYTAAKLYADGGVNSVIAGLVVSVGSQTAVYGNISECSFSTGANGAIQYAETKYEDGAKNVLLSFKEWKLFNKNKDGSDKRRECGYVVGNVYNKNNFTNLVAETTAKLNVTKGTFEKYSYDSQNTTHVRSPQRGGVIFRPEDNGLFYKGNSYAESYNGTSNSTYALETSNIKLAGSYTNIYGKDELGNGFTFENCFSLQGTSNPIKIVGSTLTSYNTNFAAKTTYFA